jgi:hypothetical protein
LTSGRLIIDDARDHLPLFQIDRVFGPYAVDHLRDQGQHPAPGDLAHLSPLGWEHINLTGDYRWETSSTFGPDQFRPLRIRAHDFAAAA